MPTPLKDHLRLHVLNRHLFIEIAGELWLIDTGSPSSFGAPRTLRLAGRTFPVPPDLHGLTAAALAEMLTVDCRGLLGADVIGCLDFVFDTSVGEVAVSTGPLSHHGQYVALSFTTGVPIVSARIGGRDRRVYFDTGAQLSYLDARHLEGLPGAGRMTDFYPGFGTFEVDTYTADCRIGESHWSLRFGVLPPPLREVMELSGTSGILGNELVLGRRWAYFPRRSRLVL